MADPESLKQKYARIVSTIESFSAQGGTVKDQSLYGENCT